GAAVAASYRLLPHLSSREHIYSNHYIFLGVKQFNAGPYEAPEDIEYVVFDADDLATYRAQFTNIAWTRAHYEGGRARLAAVAGGKIAREEKFILFGSSGAQELRSSGAETKIGFDFGIDIWLDGVHIDSDKRTMSLYWTLGAEKNDTKLVTVLLRQDGELLDIYRTPLINDLHQSAGPSDEYVQEIDLGPLVANYQAGRYIIGITLSEHDATHVLDGIRSTAEHFTELRETGGVDDVGSIDL
ncbi:MAG: hypothetical protein U9Q03_03290, partial [Patescibacteria group bacterium]|nr:hypothetical protein [Patescibacteria group bacterium]